MKKDPPSLMLFTVAKSLQELGYALKVCLISPCNRLHNKMRIFVSNNILVTVGSLKQAS